MIVSPELLVGTLILDLRICFIHVNSSTFLMYILALTANDGDPPVGQ